MGFELGTFRFWSQLLNPLGDSPQDDEFSPASTVPANLEYSLEAFQLTVSVPISKELCIFSQRYQPFLKGSIFAFVGLVFVSGANKVNFFSLIKYFTYSFSNTPRLPYYGFKVSLFDKLNT